MHVQYNSIVIVYAYMYVYMYLHVLSGNFCLGGSYKPTSHNYSTITRVHRGGELEVLGGKLKNLRGELPPCPPLDRTLVIY